MARVRHNRKATLQGVNMPGPRMTAWAWGYLAVYIALPVLTLALLLDLVMYFIFDRVFGVCYALLCLF
jgi:hypothetical protein